MTLVTGPLPYGPDEGPGVGGDGLSDLPAQADARREPYSSSISGERPEEVERIKALTEDAEPPPPVSITPYFDMATGERMESAPEAPKGDIHDGYSFTAEHGIYRADWPAPIFVVIEVDLLRQERGGEMTGEVTVRTTVPGIERDVHRARMTLTGTRARADLGRYLAKRGTHVKEDAWAELIERAFVRVIGSYREGEPPIHLWQAKRPEGDDFLMGTIAHARLHTMAFGDGGGGKSWVALAVAASIQMGRSYIEGMPVNGQRNVAYLDWEMSAWDHAERMASLCGSDHPDILYVPMAAPLPESVDRLRRIAKQYDIGYWVIDSAVLACGGEPESAAVATSYFNALRALGGASLSIAHIRKDGDGSDQKPFGSVFWHNTASYTYYAKGSETLDGLAIGLFNRKNRTGRRHDPFSIEARFEGSVTSLRMGRITEDTPELAVKVPAKQRIFELLKGGAMAQHEIVEALGISQTTVQSALARGDRYFQRISGPDGVDRWGLRARDEVA